MNTNILVVVQARIASSRLRGKILRQLCGQPMILWLLARLSTLLYEIVIAAPDTPDNQLLADMCTRHGYACHLCPGDQNDVLGRFAYVTELYPEMEHIVRVGADTPLLDPQVIEQLVQYHRDSLLNDYTGLAAEWGDGIADSEVFTRQALLLADSEATLPHHREHINPYFWEQSQRFRCGHLPCPFDLSHMRCSIDTEEDLRHVHLLLQNCLDRHGLMFRWQEVWQEVEHNNTLADYIAHRPMNPAYLTQVGSEKSWSEVRYGA